MPFIKFGGERGDIKIKLYNNRVRKKHVETGLVHWYHTAPATMVDGNQ